MFISGELNSPTNNMEWKTVKISEIADIINGGTPKTTVPEYWDGDIPWLSVKDFNNGNKYVHNAERHITDSGLKNSATNLLYPEDIIISARGTVGVISMISSKMAFNQSCFGLRARDFDSHYLYYLLKAKVGELMSQSQGSVFDTIVRATFDRIECRVPARIEDQHRIAAILSSLDDKIENNNCINANLEAQAQALFKSWFVDFEPWGGTMPDDWREGTLGEIAEFRRGKGILGKDTRPGNIPVVAGGIEPAYYHDTANTKAPVITISASGANAGFVRLYYEDVWASDCSWIDASSKNLLWVYCYLSMNRHILRHAQTGAVQPHVKAKDVNAFEIIVPTQDDIEDFINAVKPLFKQIANNQEENQRLAALRDTLLPKLMKGDIAL